MTIGGWVLLVFIWILLACLGWLAYTFFEPDSKGAVAVIIVIVLVLCAAAYGAERWYFANTASGIRAMTDEKSELANGIERVVNVYTADGNVIAQYEGKIDIEMDQGYVKFDYDGKRYIYYNCFVETIAEIP